MRVKSSLSSYENVEFTITLTAPVEDWRALLRLVEKLNTAAGNYTYAWPLGGLIGAVRSMLENLDKTHADAICKDDQAQTTSMSPT
jgi:hypothetical protein